MREILRIDIRERAERPIDIPTLRIEPAGEISKALVSDIIGAQVPDQPEIRQEGIQYGGPIDRG